MGTLNLGIYMDVDTSGGSRKLNPTTEIAAACVPFNQTPNPRGSQVGVNSVLWTEFQH